MNIQGIIHGQRLKLRHIKDSHTKKAEVIQTPTLKDYQHNKKVILKVRMDEEEYAWNLNKKNIIELARIGGYETELWKNKIVYLSINREGEKPKIDGTFQKKIEKPQEQKKKGLFGFRSPVKIEFPKKREDDVEE